MKINQAFRRWKNKPNQSQSVVSLLNESNRTKAEQQKCGIGGKRFVGYQRMVTSAASYGLSIAIKSS
jgi:hypothetical protein